MASPYFPPIWGGSKIHKVNFPPMGLVHGGEVFVNFPPTLFPMGGKTSPPNAILLPPHGRNFPPIMGGKCILCPNVGCYRVIAQESTIQ